MSVFLILFLLFVNDEKLLNIKAFFDSCRRFKQLLALLYSSLIFCFYMCELIRIIFILSSGLIFSPLYI